ncbi:MAG TPA: trypsin-like peptidase domain-containing protein [Anaerolineales bacterium]|jgi:2-alkenal reductase
MKKHMHLLAAISMLILATMACQAAQPFVGTAPIVQVNPVTQAVATVSPIYVSSEGVSQQETLTSLYEHVLPGIVAIQVTTSQGGSLGTGIVFDDQGHVVTNQHVVEGQQSIEVDFSSGHKASAKLVGTDPDSDLAVIKVDAPASEIHPLALADSKKLKVGQSVVAIGNPFGLNGTMTLGIISALGRTQDSSRQAAGGGTFSVADMIQTDAAINPGNSGGPLFNLQGEIIGINRSIRTDASNVTGEPVNSGIGFAIPINLVKRVVPAIIQSGKFEYPYMGISALQSDLMSLDVINELGLKSMTGVYITGVTPGGPAEKAGVKGGSTPTKLTGLSAGGDLVVAVDGNPVKIYDDLIGYLVDNKSPGDQITLTVLRGDTTIDLTLTLTKRP